MKQVSKRCPNCGAPVEKAGEHDSYKDYWSPTIYACGTVASPHWSPPVYDKKCLSRKDKK
jgi:hypothetical protein